MEPEDDYNGCGLFLLNFGCFVLNSVIFFVIGPYLITVFAICLSTLTCVILWSVYELSVSRLEEYISTFLS